jgi:CheY-like chemotaxis protein
MCMRQDSAGLARGGSLGKGRATRREFLTVLSAFIASPGGGLTAERGPRGPGDSAPKEPAVRPVFVVDDCEELTALYRVCLEAAGFEVWVFHDRVEALRAFVAANPRPALLITDYDGRSMSAEQFMAACRRAQPDIRILMASGYPEGCLSFGRVWPDSFLLKPFGLDQLVAEVRVLNGAAPGPATTFLQGS